MTNPNDTANSFSIPRDTSLAWAPERVDGLTKREHFAAVALSGILSGKYEGTTPRDAATLAVVCADALIAALNSFYTAQK